MFVRVPDIDLGSPSKFQSWLFEQKQKEISSQKILDEIDGASDLGKCRRMVAAYFTSTSDEVLFPLIQNCLLG